MITALLSKSVSRLVNEHAEEQCALWISMVFRLIKRY